MTYENISKEDKNDFLNSDTSNRFYGELFFVPDIEGHPELDKNITSTNLRSAYKEPERARELLKAINILQKYNKKVQQKKLIGYDKRIRKTREGEEEVLVPIYKEEEVLVPIYTRSFNYFSDQLSSLVITSKSRDGFMVREFNKRKIERTDTVEDKTKPESRFSGFGYRNKSS